MRLPRGATARVHPYIVRRQGRPGGQKLGVVQQELALAIGALDAGLTGVGAAVILQVELAVPHGQPFTGLCLEILEKSPGGAWAHTGRTGMIGQPPTVLQHLRGRAAAAIPPAEEGEQFTVCLFLLIIPPRADDQPGG